MAMVLCCPSFFPPRSLECRSYAASSKREEGEERKQLTNVSLRLPGGLRGFWIPFFICGHAWKSGGVVVGLGREGGKDDAVGLLVQSSTTTSSSFCLGRHHQRSLPLLLPSHFSLLVSCPSSDPLLRPHVVPFNHSSLVSLSVSVFLYPLHFSLSLCLSFLLSPSLSFLPLPLPLLLSSTLLTLIHVIPGIISAHAYEISRQNTKGRTPSLPLCPSLPICLHKHL